MVEKRTGDEVNLLDSSLRIVSGTSISTSFYVLSAIVYAAATSPEVAGTTLFILLVISLLTRPVRGLSQTLHKIGSEKNQRVSAYFFIALAFGSVYIIFLAVFGYLSIGFVSKYTIFESDLFVPAMLIAISSIPLSISTGLLGAIGRPGYITWVTATRDFIRIFFLILFPFLINTVEELILLFVIVRLIVLIPLFVFIGVLPTVPTSQEVYRAYEYARWSIPDQIIDRMSYNMPTFVLGVVATPFAVGVYEAADRFADFGATISWYLSSTLLTKVSGDWSAGDSELKYLDSAVTGGVGVTFVVLGYLIPTRRFIAEIAFSEAPEVFSFTVIMVGVINVMRGFWTLVSHVMEGINRPSVSFKTKLYGLIISVPPTALLGLEFGAFAGAIGYGIMNIVIFSYVVWYSYNQFERLLIDWKLLGYFTLSMIVSTVGTRIMFVLIEPLFSSVTISVIGVVTSLILYTTCMYLISSKARSVLKRAYELYLIEQLARFR